MIEVDLGGCVVQNLVFDGMNGHEVFLTASAMRDGSVWNVIGCDNG